MNFDFLVETMSNYGFRLLPRDDAKKIVRIIKDSKMKVQASIQGDAVRITGNKRDDLQEAIALLKKQVTELPLNFGNFRD